MSSYFIYFIIYGYIFLLFLKGYYPANETGILFIGFLIFMTASYKFAGALMSEELDNRRKEIFNKFESLIEQNHKGQAILEDVFIKVESHKKNLESQVNHYIAEFNQNVVEKYSEQSVSSFNHFINTQLVNAAKDRLAATRNYINTAYLLSVKKLIENKLDIDKK